MVLLPSIGALAKFMNSTIKNYLNLIKFEHTIFALPFALLTLVFLAKEERIGIDKFILIILSLIFARSFAMAFNRIVDAKIDAKNPRTSEREIPCGKITLKSAGLFVVSSAVAFIICASFFNQLTMLLAPLVLLILAFYSFCKRFTSFSHLVLGLCLCLAPGGVWVALVGEISLKPLPLMLAVVFWVAGFDILYSLQDQEFDKKNNLFSIPVRLGASLSKLLAFIFHLISLPLLHYSGEIFKMENYYLIGLTLFSIALLLQHILMATRKNINVEKLFFVSNGCGSFLLLIFAAL
jgi:4-hydroxybenzoate polyprenyltransferase